MKMYFLTFVFLLPSCGLAQVNGPKAAPQVVSMIIDEETVTTVNLSPGYATAIRLPEEISSVVIGNPASFKAEHSNSEPRLVFLKPITVKAAESNAVITTKSGQEISLHLISKGQAAAQQRVDFFLEYRRPRSMLISSNTGQSFFVSQTRPFRSGDAADSHRGSTADPIAEMLAQQKAVSVPRWQGDSLQVAIGESREHDHQTMLGFSVLNHSNRIIELQLPEIELSGNGKGRRVKAEAVAIGDLRLTSRRLAPGERADGVVVFERPSFKESTEELELQVAESGQVDHPVRIPIPFVASAILGVQ